MESVIFQLALIGGLEFDMITPVLQPWRLKYRRMESPEAIKTVTLRTPNDQLNVVDDGLYEITEVIRYISWNVTSG